MCDAIAPILDADNYQQLQQQLSEIRQRYLQPGVSQRVVNSIENLEPQTITSR
jgi:hypothetical protein